MLRKRSISELRPANRLKTGRDGRCGWRVRSRLVQPERSSYAAGVQSYLDSS